MLRAEISHTLNDEIQRLYSIKEGCLRGLHLATNFKNIHIYYKLSHSKKIGFSANTKYYIYL